MIAEPKRLVEDVLVVELKRAVFEEKRADALQFFTHFRRPELYGELVSLGSARDGETYRTEPRPLAAVASRR